MSCFKCQNVAFGGPTMHQQYVDVFGHDPLPTTYVCGHCNQWWEGINGREWSERETPKGRVGDDRLTEQVLGAHGHSGQQTRIDMIIEGRKFSLLGTAETIVPFDGTEEIELLSKNATPDCEVLDDKAPEKFYNAVRRLAEEQKPFRTVLRSSWTTATVFWSPGTRA